MGEWVGQQYRDDNGSPRAYLQRLGSAYTAKLFWPRGQVIDDLASSPGMPLDVARRYAEWATAALDAGEDPLLIRIRMERACAQPCDFPRDYEYVRRTKEGEG